MPNTYRWTWTSLSKHLSIFVIRQNSKYLKHFKNKISELIQFFFSCSPSFTFTSLSSFFFLACFNIYYELHVATPLSYLFNLVLCSFFSLPITYLALIIHVCFYPNCFPKDSVSETDPDFTNPSDFPSGVQPEDAIHHRSWWIICRAFVLYFVFEKLDDHEHGNVF